jgi:hypothetical protein
MAPLHTGGLQPKSQVEDKTEHNLPQANAQAFLQQEKSFIKLTTINSPHLKPYFHCQ